MAHERRERSQNLIMLRSNMIDIAAVDLRHVTQARFGVPINVTQPRTAQSPLSSSSPALLNTMYMIRLAYLQYKSQLCHVTVPDFRFAIAGTTLRKIPGSISCVWFTYCANFGYYMKPRSLKTYHLSKISGFSQGCYRTDDRHCNEAVRRPKHWFKIPW
jgi:hypothetical protein